jgi:hypothetical protein
VPAYQTDHRPGRSDIELLHASLPGGRGAGHRAAGAHHLDLMSFWREASLVYLRRPVDGKYCGRRVAVLYLAGEWPGSRMTRGSLPMRARRRSLDRHRRARNSKADLSRVEATALPCRKTLSSAVKDHHRLLCISRWRAKRSLRFLPQE